MNAFFDACKDFDRKKAIEIFGRLSDEQKRFVSRSVVNVTPMFEPTMTLMINLFNSVEWKETILAYNPMCINEPDSYGRTPIFFAQTADVSRFLFDRGADANVVDCNGRTLLMGAHVAHDLKLLEVILEHNPSLDIIGVRNNSGSTIYDLIYWSKNNSFARLLVVYLERKGWLAKDIAAAFFIMSLYSDDTDVIELLLARSEKTFSDYFKEGEEWRSRIAPDEKVARFLVRESIITKAFVFATTFDAIRCGKIETMKVYFTHALANGYVLDLLDRIPIDDAIHAPRSFELFEILLSMTDVSYFTDRRWNCIEEVEKDLKRGIDVENALKLQHLFIVSHIDNCGPIPELFDMIILAKRLLILKGEISIKITS